jgi:hypothetical protein
MSRIRVRTKAVVAATLIAATAFATVAPVASATAAPKPVKSAILKAIL